MEGLKEETLMFEFAATAHGDDIKLCELIRKSVYDEGFYIECCKQFDLQALKKYFDIQHNLDDIFDKQDGKYYNIAREKLFPLSARGSTRYFNRAGDKLSEILECTGIQFTEKEDFTFADVCAAPGAWSLYLLEKYAKCKGVGMSMPVKGTKLEETWYPELRTHSRFKITFGADGTGNIYNYDNLLAVRDFESSKYHFIMCDGGFAVPCSSSGEHREHLEEPVTQRLLTGEFLLALLCLDHGGNFICKMYDSLSEYSAQLLYLMSMCFEELIIIKPAHSRLVNAEKYIVLKRYAPVERVIDILTSIYQGWEDDTCFMSIFAECEGYPEFEKFLCNINSELVDRTTRGLSLVINETNKIRPRNERTITITRRPEYSPHRVGHDAHYAEGWGDSYYPMQHRNAHPLHSEYRHEYMGYSRRGSEYRDDGGAHWGDRDTRWARNNW